MCGIISIHRIDKCPVARMVMKRYRAQKSRGQEGFGYLAIKDNKLIVLERNAEEKPILEKLEKENASTVLFHHRMPTSTPNFAEATHPITVRHESLKYDYFVVHNGVITNAKELYDAHLLLGFKYTTFMVNQWVTREESYLDETKFNDSESLAIEIVLKIEGKKDKIETRGSAAFVCYQADKDGKLVAIYYGKNFSNPLVFQHTKDFFSLTSEGKGVSILSDHLYKYDPATDAITREICDIGVSYYREGKKSGYDYTDREHDTGFRGSHYTGGPWRGRETSFVPIEREEQRKLLADDIQYDLGPTDEEIEEMMADEKKEDVKTHTITATKAIHLPEKGEKLSDYIAGIVEERQRSLDFLESCREKGSGVGTKFWQNKLKELNKILNDYKEMSSIGHF